MRCASSTSAATTQGSGRSAAMAAARRRWPNSRVCPPLSSATTMAGSRTPSSFTDRVRPRRSPRSRRTLVSTVTLLGSSSMSFVLVVICLLSLVESQEGEPFGSERGSPSGGVFDLVAGAEGVEDLGSAGDDALAGGAHGVGVAAGPGGDVAEGVVVTGEAMVAADEVGDGLGFDLAHGADRAQAAVR